MTLRRKTMAVLASLLAMAPAVQAQTQDPRPALVVFITVDQLRPDYFERYAGQLTGGLARLSRGAFFTDAYQDHAITETAPGHASTLSGRFPASTGIVANAYGVGDRQAPLLTGTMAGASPFRFRGSVLMDWMRTRDERSRGLSISRKDRGAILPMGRAKQSVFWYDYAGGFTTSTYYADTLPTWVRQFNARRIPQGYAGRAWTLLLPEAQYPEADEVQVESRNPYVRGQREVTFPHGVPANPDSAARYFAEFPFMDELTAGAAVTGLRAMNLGRGPATDLLAVSFSTTDAVGHRYGPDSREIHDQVLRLDRTLGAFMDSVYAQVDSSRVVFALTADHGVASFPEVAFGDRAAAYHVSLDTLVRRYRDALMGLGAPATALEQDDGIVFVRPEQLPAGVDPEPLLRDFVEAARRVPGVARVDWMRDLRAMDPAARDADEVARRWVHMIPRDQPIPIVITLGPGVVWGAGSSAMHGTPHGYDAHVPVLFYGAGIRGGRYDAFARVVDIAPTLAEVIGVPPTEALDGRVLREALQ